MTLPITDFWVDPDYCLAHYLCVDLAPLFFEMRDDAWMVSVRRVDLADMAAADIETLIQASIHCPVDAIKIRTASGSVIDGKDFLPKSPAKARPNP